MAQVNEMIAQIGVLELGPPPPLLHSGQGWQCRQKFYQLKLAELGITQSMSRKATCLDNACMGGFFGRMKDEFYRGQSFESFEELEARLFGYISHWNNRGYQTGLKGMTPVLCRGHSIGFA